MSQSFDNANSNCPKTKEELFSLEKQSETLHQAYVKCRLVHHKIKNEQLRSKAAFPGDKRPHVSNAQAAMHHACHMTWFASLEARHMMDKCSVGDLKPSKWYHWNHWRTWKQG